MKETLALLPIGVPPPAEERLMVRLALPEHIPVHPLFAPPPHANLCLARAQRAGGDGATVTSREEIKHHLPRPAWDCPPPGWQRSEGKLNPPKLPASSRPKNHDKDLLPKWDSPVTVTGPRRLSLVCPCLEVEGEWEVRIRARARGSV